jgi:hypothetical protein
MKDSLLIEGKQYISTSRAAEIAGYSNDYVGQLCRSGKLDCWMIGRNWYVEEASILKHKNESRKPNQTAFRKGDFFSDMPAGEPIQPRLSVEPLPKQVLAPEATGLTRPMPPPDRLASSPMIWFASAVAAITLTLVIVTMSVGRFYSLSSGPAATANVSSAVSSVGQIVLSGWDALSSKAVSLTSGFRSRPLVPVSHTTVLLPADY